jgi:ABC-type transporter Mla MlaB component
MRLKNLSESSLKLLEKYNITKEDLVNRPDKAAVATLIHLADLYKNTGRNFDKVLSLWNNGKYYS